MIDPEEKKLKLMKGKGEKWEMVTHSMKLSYSMDLFLPPVLSNLETSKSKTIGDTANPRLKSASRNSFASILPLLSLSNRSNIPYSL